ncbi:hypothetical protein ACD591_04950 [Rufibacter glacialis]|uniref:Uncharacterized protein n=1 Tax=Rufibacter glacialis TaxID=1259555 RepID=A0A5M8QFB3_9BACT|nr:hypothetical protein [Rufibacter glacialis]KAA6434699.1 hypothetical protein FOE74_11005 [Rufibacter glacialis]GGK71699.1 hypothetical protein GCM10011405_19900 [Rufibacter glacialis]
MEDNGKLALDYFYNRIKSKIKQIIKEEIGKTEYNARILTGGLGLEEELKFFEKLLAEKKDTLKSPSGHFILPEKFTKKELQQKEFDTPSIIENRIEVYQSPYEERKLDFINPLAKFYSNLDYLEYLKSRITGLKLTLSNSNNQNSKKGEGKTTLVWVGNSQMFNKLHASLTEEKIIGEIDLNIFRKHFEGIVQKEPINFLAQKALVFYLLDKLAKYINVGFYTHSKGSSSVTVVAKHFIFNGKESKDLYSVKSKGINPANKHLKKRIDLIINRLSS